MKKIIFSFMFLFISNVTFAESPFAAKLKNCEQYSDETGSIIKKVENKCEVELLGEKPRICSFDMEKISLIAGWIDNTVPEEVRGNYDLQVKFDMPEMSVDKDDKEELSIFNFKMKMPEIKMEKRKSEVDIIVDSSCSLKEVKDVKK